MNTYAKNTGLEAALNDRLMIATNEVEKLKSEVDELEHAYNNMKQYADRLLDENVEVGERNEELKTNMALMTDEIEGLKQANMGLVCDNDDLKDEVTELEKSYKNECHETEVYKKAWRENRELVALRDDQIAMLERRLTKREEDKN